MKSSSERWSISVRTFNQSKVRNGVQLFIVDKFQFHTQGREGNAHGFASGPWFQKDLDFSYQNDQSQPLIVTGNLYLWIILSFRPKIYKKQLFFFFFGFPIQSRENKKLANIKLEATNL
jgi:hypothetical protein